MVEQGTHSKPVLGHRCAKVRPVRRVLLGRDVDTDGTDRVVRVPLNCSDAGDQRRSVMSEADGLTGSVTTQGEGSSSTRRAVESTTKLRSTASASPPWQVRRRNEP